VLASGCVWGVMWVDAAAALCLCLCLCLFVLFIGSVLSAWCSGFRMCLLCTSFSFAVLGLLAPCGSCSLRVSTLSISLSLCSTLHSAWLSCVCAPADPVVDAGFECEWATHTAPLADQAIAIRRLPSSILVMWLRSLADAALHLGLSAALFGALLFRQLLDAAATRLQEHEHTNRERESEQEEGNHAARQHTADHQRVSLTDARQLTSLPNALPEFVPPLLSVVQQLVGGDEATRQFAVEPALGRPDLPALFNQFHVLLSRASAQHAHHLSVVFYAMAMWLPAVTLFRVGVPGERTMDLRRLACDVGPLLHRTLHSAGGARSLPPASLIRHLLAALLSQCSPDHAPNQTNKREQKQVRVRAWVLCVCVYSGSKCCE
jgi:hypothetical protein